MADALPGGSRPPSPPRPGGRARVISPAVFDRQASDFRQASLPPLLPLVPLYLLDVLTAATVGMVPPLLPLLADEWMLSAVEVGLINTVYAVGRLAASYPASRIRARWGTRAAVFLGLGALVAGGLGCGLAGSFPGFLAGRLLMGLGASAAFLAIFAELLETSPGPWRGRLANGFEAMAIVSLWVGGMLAAALVRPVGWRGIFAGVGVLLLSSLTVWRRIGPSAGRSRGPSTGGVVWPGGATLRPLLPVHAAGLTMAMTWAGLFSTLVPLLGYEHYGLSPEALGVALGAGYVAELVGLVGLGLVIDRTPREPVFLAGALSVAVGGLVLAAGARPGLFVVGLMLVGAGFAGWMIPATVLADRAGTPLPPAHLAVYRIAMDIGMVVGPLLLGTLAGLAGDRLAVGVAGFALVAGAFALIRR